MRALLRFFVLGALLLVGKRALGGPRVEPPTLHITLKQAASAAELERAIDEAVLVEHAVARGGALVDPVVREQLLSNMRSQRRTTDHDDDAALLQEALALGLHRADVVTRQRLVFQAEQLLLASLPSEPASEQALHDYLKAHADRYAVEPRFSLVQVALSSRRGAQLADDAQQLLVQLQSEQTSALAASRRGDPTLLPRSWSYATASALDARFGAGFAAALSSLPERVWSGPVASAYGLHLVLLTERHAGTLPPLSSLRERVASDYHHDRRRELLRQRVRALRHRFQIDVQRLQS